MHLIEGLLHGLSLGCGLLLAYQDPPHVVDAGLVACVGECDFEVVRLLRSPARQVLLRDAAGMDLALADLVRVGVEVPELFVRRDDLHVDGVLELLLSPILLAGDAFGEFNQLCDYLLVLAVAAVGLLLFSALSSELRDCGLARLLEMAELDDSFHGPPLDQLLLRHLELTRPSGLVGHLLVLRWGSELQQVLGGPSFDGAHGVPGGRWVAQMVHLHRSVARAEAVCEEVGVGGGGGELPATAAADHGAVGVQVLLVVLGEELAGALLDYSEDGLLVLEAFLAQFVHYRLDFVLDQLENAWLHLS